MLYILRSKSCHKDGVTLWWKKLGFGWEFGENILYDTLKL